MRQQQEGDGIITLFVSLLAAPFFIGRDRAEKWRRLDLIEQNLRRAQSIAWPAVLIAASILFFGPSAPPDFMGGIVANPAAMWPPAVLLAALLIYCAGRFRIGARRLLGHLAELEQANSILRGFGSRLTMVFQSLDQIKKLYPDTWGLFTGGTVLAFRPVDVETGKWMVEKTGNHIVRVKSAADPSSPNDFGMRPSWGQQKRERIPLTKMFGMPQGRALVWLPNEELPRISHVKGYFEIPELAARASPNPYYTGSASAGGGGAVKNFAVVAAIAALIGGGWLLSPKVEVPARASVAPPVTHHAAVPMPRPRPPHARVN